jgi:hypothetical protein
VGYTPGLEQTRLAFRVSSITAVGEYPLDEWGHGIAIRTDQLRVFEAYRIEGTFDHVAGLLGIKERES